jgi:TetR/AcrR family transcriptional regulator
MAARLYNAASGPRQRRGEASRAAILAAAERIFADSGLAGARTDAIAAKAGVNKALLYYYFKSKDDLYRAVLEDHVEKFSREAMRALASEGSARAVVLRYVGTHFDFLSSRPYYSRLLERLIAAPHGQRFVEPLVKRYSVPLARRLMEVIERGVREGEFRAVASHHTAISLAALTVFYFSAAPVIKAVARIDPYEPRQLQSRREEVLNFIRYGLFRDPSA